MSVTYPYRQPCGCLATDPQWIRLCADHRREKLDQRAERAQRIAAMSVPDLAIALARAVVSKEQL